jgi:MoaA/NifB/PqqE/SkfB family radical SAM enzyme
VTAFIDPARKLFAHMDRLTVLQAGGMPVPVNVEIDLSNRCSLGCEWCHFAYTHTRGPLKGKRAKPVGAVAGGDLMDTELAFDIVDQLIDAGVCSITWTGGGEPTLHPDFDDIVEHGAGRIAQGIYTHGGHIDDNRAALLKEHFTFVYVSLDAADAESYKRDKGVDRFGKVCENIGRLVAADGDAAVGVGYLVTPGNWRKVWAAASLAHDLAVDYIQFRPTIMYDQANPDGLAEDTVWIDRVLEDLSQLSHFGHVIVDLDRFRLYKNWHGHDYHTCFWSGLQTVVTPNGKMWTCVNKREHPGAEIGDLSQERFAVAWSRNRLAQVAADCRVMCRGHLPNVTLNQIMAPQAHAEFI